MNVGGSNKRRRTDDSLLGGLPDVVLSHVASYLAKPSCALFAVAPSAPSPSWRDGNGEARRQPSPLLQLFHPLSMVGALR